MNTSVQFTSLHSSWSQPTLPCAVSPSSVAEPVRASESASRSVAETDSPSKALALICVLYRSSVPADCCTSPEAVNVHRSCRVVGQARRLEVRTKVQLRNSVWRHGEVHLGRVSGGLVAHEAAVQRVVDVVGLGHVHHEVGGRAGSGRRRAALVAVHAHSRGVRGQNHAAAAAGANRPV